MSKNQYPKSLEPLRGLVLSMFVAGVILRATRSTVTIHQKQSAPRQIPIERNPIRPVEHLEEPEMFYDPEIRTFEQIDTEIAHQFGRLVVSRVSDSEPLQQLFEQRMNLALEHRFQLKHDIDKASVELVQREPVVPEFSD